MSYVIVENEDVEIPHIQSSTTNSTLEIIDIPSDCVEYVGKFMSGEIIEATVVNIDNIMNIWKDGETIQLPEKNQLCTTTTTTPDFIHKSPTIVNVPTIMQEQHIIERDNVEIQRVAKEDASSNVSNPLNNKCLTPVFRNIYETHIHICECIAVFSCCICVQE